MKYVRHGGVGLGGGGSRPMRTHCVHGGGGGGGQAAVCVRIFKVFNKGMYI